MGLFSAFFVIRDNVLTAFASVIEQGIKAHGALVLTWEILGVQISKHYPSYSYGSFSTKLFLNVPRDSLHKIHLSKVKLRIQFFKKKDLKFNIVVNGKISTSFSYNSFSTNLFLTVPCNSPHKNYLLGF